jgi:hypothetical protein
MIVVLDRSSRLLVQHQLDDCPRIYAGAVNGTAKEFDAVNDLMPLIDRDLSKALIIQVPNPHRGYSPTLHGD